jgi:hypothetical protein
VIVGLENPQPCQKTGVERGFYNVVTIFNILKIIHGFLFLGLNYLHLKSRQKNRHG